jgi:hypothetical protein
VRGLPRADLGAGRHRVPQIAHAAGQIVIYLLTGAKNDTSAPELARQIGVKWDTAWLIKQKLMEVHAPAQCRLQAGGEVQIDDFVSVGITTDTALFAVACDPHVARSLDAMWAMRAHDARRLQLAEQSQDI